MKYLLMLLYIGLMWGQDYDPESGEIVLKSYNPNTGQKDILNDSLKAIAANTVVNYIKDSLSVDNVVVSNWYYFGGLSLPLSIISSKVFPNTLFRKNQRNSDLARITAFIGTCISLGFPYLMNEIYLEEIYYPSEDMSLERKSLYDNYYLKQIKKFNRKKIIHGQLTYTISSGVIIALLEIGRQSINVDK